MATISRRSSVKLDYVMQKKRYVSWCFYLGVESKFRLRLIALSMNDAKPTVSFELFMYLILILF